MQLCTYVLLHASEQALLCLQVESFWSLWTHLNFPSSLLPTTDYILFHKGIRRPVWEDPLNLSGGKWIIRLRKGVADRLWEELVLAVIGDQFADCEVVSSGQGADGGSEWPQICGCTISVRQNEDIITVWNRVEDDAKVKEKIKYVVCWLLGFVVDDAPLQPNDTKSIEPAPYDHHGIQI